MDLKKKILFSMWYIDFCNVSVEIVISVYK